MVDRKTMKQMLTCVCIIQQVIQIYLTNTAITSLYCGMCVRMGEGMSRKACSYIGC